MMEQLCIISERNSIKSSVQGRQQKRTKFLLMGLCRKWNCQSFTWATGMTEEKKMKNEEDILRAIQADDWMMAVLETAERLNLPDWWICAGFVRTKIWDELHGFNERTPLEDIDVVYFNPEAVDEAEEKRFEEKLLQLMPDLPWSVKNEAKM